MFPFVVCAAVPMFLFLAFNSLPRMNRAAAETRAPELIFVLYLIGGWIGLALAGVALSVVFGVLEPKLLVVIWELTCGAMLIFAILWTLQVLRFPFFSKEI